MNDPTNSLRELVSYYLRCLEIERRHEADFPLTELDRSFFRVSAPSADDWGNAFAADTQTAARCAQVATTKGLPVMFAVLVRLSGDTLRPIAGVFGKMRGSVFEPDPQAIHVASPLDSELPEEQLVALRDTLERAVRSGPDAFVRAVLSAASELDPPEIPLGSDIREAGEVAAAFMPCLMVVESEARYDRGLVTELEHLAADATAHTQSALGHMLSPVAQNTPPSWAALLRALANPICPTFAQAEVIALTTCYPAVTVTGPPGTGKTRTIVGLIVEALLQSQSVLLASRINFAVDAAVSLAEQLLGPVLLRTGSEQARERLRLRLADLSQASSWPGINLPTPASAPDGRMPNIDRETAVLARLSRQLSECRFPLRWWNLVSKARERRFHDVWASLNERLASVRETVIPGMRASRTLELRTRLDALLGAARPHLNRLSAALSAGTRERHRTFETLVRLGFPIAVTNLAVSSNIPLHRGVFDLLIVDEASACDPASILPLLYRARRAVIVGDPQQLTHIYQRSVRQVVPVPMLRTGDGLPFPASFEASSFHLLSQATPSTAHRTLLDHFRCPSQIIRFASAQFYGSILRIRTTDVPDAITTHIVAGSHRTARGRSKTNPEQVEAVHELLARLAEQYPMETLGVVTPWRAFKEDLRSSIAADATLAPLLESGRLIADTAHGFQGTEVDNLVFATVVGSNPDRSALSWLEHPNLFNVAITRARKRLFLIASQDLLDNRESRLLRPLAADQQLMESSSENGDGSSPLASWLRSLGLKVVVTNQYRGFPVTMHGSSGDHHWALRVLSWDETARLTPVELLRLTYDAADLHEMGVQSLLVPPIGVQQVVTRWLAEKGLVPGL